MNSPLVYLAEPIDQSTKRPSWDRAYHPGWTVFSPKRAYLSDNPGQEIEQANRAVLACADGMLASLPSGTPSIGVPAEIEWSLSNGIPVVILTDCWMSLAVMGFERRGAVLAETPDEAHQKLDKLMAESPRRDTLGFVAVKGGAQLPTKGYPDDAGMDLYSCGDMEIPANQFRDVPCGVVANLPADSWGLIVGRSSTVRKLGLWVYQGVIDASFRGELMVGAFNGSGAICHVKDGDRLGQLIIMPASSLRPVWAEEVLPGASTRGQNGFGSTGA